MTNRLTPVLVWWEARAPREQLLLAVLSGLVTLWLGVAVLWQPLQAARVRLGDQIVRYDRALSVLHAQPVAAAPVIVPDDRALNVIVTETAATFQLTIRRLEPEGARIRVVLDEVPFESAILWLDALQREAGLTVHELEMTRRPPPGVVNVALALERTR